MTNYQRYIDREISQLYAELICCQSCNCVPGKDGIKGAKGDEGAKGDKGLTGTKGDKGEKGDRGIDGVKGDSGAPGVQGEKGAQGAKGNKGDTGADGPVGIPGLKGDKGAMGIKGDAASCDIGCLGSIAQGDIEKGSVVRFRGNITGDSAFIKQIVADNDVNWVATPSVGPDVKNCVIREVVSDCFGNVFVLGFTQIELTFNTINAPVQISPGFFIAKLNYDGEWIAVIGDTLIYPDPYVNVYGLSVSCNTNVYYLVETVNVLVRELQIVVKDTNLVVSSSAATGISAVNIKKAGTRIGINSDVYVFASTSNSLTIPTVNVGFVRIFTSLLVPLGFVFDVTTNDGDDVFLISDLTTDCQGNFYIVGVSFGTVDFSTFGIVDVSITSSEKRLYLAKNNGIRWSSAFQTGGQRDLARQPCICNDYLGNVHVACAFRDQLSFSDQTYYARSGNYSIFVARFSYGLVFQNIITAPIFNNPIINVEGVITSIASDIRGNVYLTSEFTETAIFNRILTNSNPNLVSQFVAQIHNDRWSSAIKFSSLGAITNLDRQPQFLINANGQGDIYVGSNFSAQITIDDNVIIQSGSSFVIVDVTSDRTLHLFGISPENVANGNSINPILNAVTAFVSSDPLIPGFEYYLNASGQIVFGCPCQLCNDPLLTYLGTACSNNTLIFSPQFQ